MEKEEIDHGDDDEDNYYTSMDYSHLDRQQHHQFMKQQQQAHEMGSSSISSVEAHDHASTYNINQGLMVDYMFNNSTTTLEPPSLVIQQSNTSIAPAASAGFLNGTNTASTSFDRLSFAEVMQFADFGPKLASNQQQVITTSNKISSSDEETGGMDPVYFLKFPVLSDRLLQEDNSNHHQYLPPPLPVSNEIELQGGDKFNGEEEDEEEVEEAHYHHHHQQQHGVDSHDDGNVNSSVVKCNRVLGGGNNEVMTLTTIKNTNNNRRKRPRSVKTSEEVESQRMTHIAVERNRRKQMNEHLRVLRSLMPGSYVQRGDQASIIGGAIEFVRELEQLLQCLESQKRRKLFGSSTAENNNVQNRSLNDQSSASPAIMPVLPHQLQAVPAPQIYPPPPAFPNADQMNIKHSNNIDEFEVVPFQGGIREDAAENKSCLADVEVKVLGDDAMIKILSKRRPGQLLKTIAALEDLQFNILHTNITTIEQTVLYSFNVKVAAASETTRFSAEDIASSVQQIFSFIHASSNSITNI